MFKKAVAIAALIALVVALPAAPAFAQSGKIEILWLGQSVFKITTLSRN